MSNIDLGAIIHWILSYLAVSWIFFIGAVGILLRIMRYGGLRRSWRHQESGAIWFWAILLFTFAGIMGYIAMQTLGHPQLPYHN